MTPAEIDILLHYYARGGDHPRVKDIPHSDFDREVLARFLAADLLTTCGDGSRLYRLTFRGECYVGMLMDVPIPSMSDVITLLTGAINR